MAKMVYKVFRDCLDWVYGDWWSVLEKLVYTIY